MDLSYLEAVAIDSARKVVVQWRRGILTQDEVVRAIIVGLVRAGDGAERVIPPCVAALPLELRDRLRGYVGELATQDYRGWYCVVGTGPSDEELEQLRPQCRAVCEGVERVLREAKERPSALDEAAGIEVDVFWALLRDRPTAENPPCRRPGCTALSLNSSIYCPRHHYEEIEGRSPPEG
ncbi:MAG: hypothetical protein U0835_13575 [Isosphaeraceae bacterium]